MPALGVKVDLSSIGGAVKDVGKAVTDFAANIQGKLTPDQQLAFVQVQQAIDTAQNTVNDTEARSPSLFVAGWRPAVGWICTLALGFHVLLKPLVEWGFTIAGGHIELPTLDTNTVFTLLFSLLGLGSMRTVEKFGGVAGNH